MMISVWRQFWQRGVQLDGADEAFRAARRRKQQRGMTLVEIMVVVVIISLVAGVVGVQVFGQLKKAQINTAQTQIRQISEALDLYKLNFRNYPSTGEGLAALVSPKENSEPFLPEVPEDPWGEDYIYIYPGSKNTGRFDLMSNGPDGVQGGGDDVGNWKTTE
jgi:general secretion pathway protein G